MIRVVVDAGADVNAPTHEFDSDSARQFPLDCELWLELDGPYRDVNRRKRDYLVAHGARHSAAAEAAAAAAAAAAAVTASAKAAAQAAADAALEQRLLEARREADAARVPTWDAE